MCRRELPFNKGRRPTKAESQSGGVQADNRRSVAASIGNRLPCRRISASSHRTCAPHSTRAGFLFNGTSGNGTAYQSYHLHGGIPYSKRTPSSMSPAAKVKAAADPKCRSSPISGLLHTRMAGEADSRPDLLRALDHQKQELGRRLELVAKRLPWNAQPQEAKEVHAMLDPCPDLSHPRHRCVAMDPGELNQSRKEDG